MVTSRLNVGFGFRWPLRSSASRLRCGFSRHHFHSIPAARCCRVAPHDDPAISSRDRQAGRIPRRPRFL